MGESARCCKRSFFLVRDKIDKIGKIDKIDKIDKIGKRDNQD